MKNSNLVLSTGAIRGLLNAILPEEQVYLRPTDDDLPLISASRPIEAIKELHLFLSMAIRSGYHVAFTYSKINLAEGIEPFDCVLVHIRRQDSEDYTQVVFESVEGYVRFSINGEHIYEYPVWQYRRDRFVNYLKSKKMLTKYRDSLYGFYDKDIAKAKVIDHVCEGNKIEYYFNFPGFEDLTDEWGNEFNNNRGNIYICGDGEIIETITNTAEAREFTKAMMAH